MLRSILVPVDGSSFGEHALPMAVSLAQKANAVLHLVHVHQAVPPAHVAGVAIMDTLELHRRQDEQAYLSDLTRRVTEGRSVAVETALLEGDVAAALRDHAAAKGVGLMVLSTHGRGALSRFWLGSIADQLVREATLPIMLFRPQDGRPELKKEVALKKVLLPLDGTELAEAIIEPALALAGLFGAELILARVVQPVIRPAYVPEGTTVIGLAHELPEEIAAFQSRLQDEAKGYLDGVAARLRGRGAKVESCVVVEEQAAAGLLREAQARHVDLIAMETHARRGLSRLFLGSVADKVVRAGVAPVLLSHPSR
jgi:nucleotide-binding universal stress UspA family protein